MQRLKAECLVVADGLFYEGDRLYTGVVYVTEGEVVREILDVEEGRLAQRPPEDFGLRAYRTAIDILDQWDLVDIEPFLHQSKPLTGVAYLFDGCFCVGAYVFEEGYLVKEVGWFESGRLGYYKRLHPNVGEAWAWRADGTQSEILLYEKGVFRLNAAFDALGRLERLSVRGMYFGRSRENAWQFEFPFMIEAREISLNHLSQKVILSGSGIVDELLQAIIASSQFKEGREIKLLDTQVTPEFLDEIRDIPGVEVVPLDERGMAARSELGRRHLHQSWALRLVTSSRKGDA